MCYLEGKNVFLSGPMTGIECNNITEFIRAHEILNGLGVRFVYDPACEWAKEIDSGSSEPKSHEHYMRKCLHELTRGGYIPERADFSNVEQPTYYDAIVMLDGWEKSRGSSIEFDVALACGIEVIEWEEIERYGKQD